jgi:hypothetical protein
MDLFKKCKDFTTVKETKALGVYPYCSYGRQERNNDRI